MTLRMELPEALWSLYVEENARMHDAGRRADYTAQREHRLRAEGHLFSWRVASRMIDRHYVEEAGKAGAAFGKSIAGAA